ncbi:choline dehydrogenase [Nereida sp. MMG025]|uniref:choline dehydrogenase n=1 Tax=Nereida sp. MMG025 TaxID=2909981 RepID=UPI001EFF89D6|nr:choline dehydrogenase [Nereida sp. MMG025]MCF6445780.1 choline dehydrogenase [Nereida sp. MMG025]
MKAEYVIIGAGSAGSALAFRLTQAGKSVIVLEAGGSDAGPLINMPGALSYPMNMERYAWRYWTEPEPHLGGRQIYNPRGKVIGGSSSINGMIYVRGHAMDYETWADMGADGWAYADVLPYFKRMENWNGGASAYRGDSGPLHVSKSPMRNLLYQTFIDAGAQAGFEITEDYNGEKQEGFAAFDATIHAGKRWSAARAYMKPAVKMGAKLIHCEAQRLRMDGTRCVGVETDKGFIAAEAEVIVSASPFNTPKLLMLSGIGPADHLRDHGIEVVADRQGVGQNLQDHLELYIQQACTQPITLYRYWPLPKKMQVGLQWVLAQLGPGASNGFESCGFVRSKAGVQYPDIQYHFLPLAVRYDGTAAAEGHGWQAHVGPMRSKSRGAVTLKSADPKEPPRIQFNYMSHPEDWEDFRHCIRLTREIFGQAAFDPYRGKEISPGADVQSDDDLDAFIAEHVESAYHPCGTARMGRADDPMAVVDPACRVIGVQGLRVADSSVFPQVTNGNLNGPSIMVGEKAADHILGRGMLPRENLAPWINPRWQTSDR